MLGLMTEENYGEWHSESWEQVTRVILQREKVAFTQIERFVHASNIVYQVDPQYVVKLFPPFHKEGYRMEARVLVKLTDELRHELMALLFSHQVSNLPRYVERQRVQLENATLEELACLFFPW